MEEKVTFMYDSSPAGNRMPLFGALVVIGLYILAFIWYYNSGTYLPSTPTHNAYLSGFLQGFFFLPDLVMLVIHGHGSLWQSALFHSVNAYSVCYVLGGLLLVALFARVMDRLL